jgi:flagellar FliL protein
MSDAEAKNESAPSDSGSSGGGGGSKLVLILTGVNVLATLAMVGILFMSFQKEKKAPSVEDIAAHSASAEGHGEAKKEEGHGEAAAHGEGHGGGEHGDKSAEKKKGPEFGKMVTLEQFTVNLATPGSVNPKFVRVNVSLEVPPGDAEGEVTSKMPQVRNVIIDLFNSKRPGDLATAEGRDYLKEEIRNAINGFMVTGKVKGVFFTNFALSS